MSDVVFEALDALVQAIDIHKRIYLCGEETLNRSIEQARRVLRQRTAHQLGIPVDCACGCGYCTTWHHSECISGLCEHSPKRMASP